MAVSTDPFSIVYDALWQMVEDYSGFTDLVNVGNRLRFASDIRDPLKRETLTNDFPAVGILANGHFPHLQRTSNSSTVTSRFIFMLVSGEQQLDRALYPITWEMLRAMTKWATRLQALTWETKTFVTLAKPIDSSEIFTEDTFLGSTKGILGWSGRWDYEVEMQFLTADLNP
ncbi:hypothetical protein LCGC14_0357510 [marine sediment metagenome]|uniref:Uncharacterized protein n=1 Tax=marine sediment metagenome TaxID=412755 RepID=A0A0F9TS70_9ZZZZ